MTCPGCGERFAAQVPTSINAHRSPEYRDSILGGEFQQRPCPSCGQIVSVTGPFIYLDFGRRQVMGCFPATEIGHWPDLAAEVQATYEANLGRDGPPLARTLGDGCVVRATVGLAALREKLVLFDAMLDDAVVEAVKLDLVSGGVGFDPDRPMRVEAASLDGSMRIHLGGSGFLDLRAETYRRRAEEGLQPELAKALSLSAPFVDLVALFFVASS